MALRKPDIQAFIYDKWKDWTAPKRVIAPIIPLETYRRSGETIGVTPPLTTEQVITDFLRAEVITPQRYGPYIGKDGAGQHLIFDIIGDGRKHQYIAYTVFDNGNQTLQFLGGRQNSMPEISISRQAGNVILQGAKETNITNTLATLHTSLCKAIVVEEQLHNGATAQAYDAFRRNLGVIMITQKNLGQLTEASSAISQTLEQPTQTISGTSGQKPNWLLEVPDQEDIFAA